MAKQDIRYGPTIHLTPIEISGNGDIPITVSQMIAYSQNDGFTRLRLTGGKMVDVKETTDRIDYLIRCACGTA